MFSVSSVRGETIGDPPVAEFTNCYSSPREFAEIERLVKFVTLADAFLVHPQSFPKKHNHKPLLTFFPSSELLDKCRQNGAHDHGD